MILSNKEIIEIYSDFRKYTVKFSGEEVCSHEEKIRKVCLSHQEVNKKIEELENLIKHMKDISFKFYEVHQKISRILSEFNMPDFDF